MNKNANIARGTTLYQGGTVPSSYTESVSYEGQICVGPYVDPATKLPVDGATVVTRIVRNTSGGALLPGTIVTYQSGYRGKRVDDTSDADAQEVAGVVDDLLPAAGVAHGDVFHITVHGITDCLPSPGTSDVTGTLSPGIFLQTSATSGGDGGFKPLTTYSGTGSPSLTQLGTCAAELKYKFAKLEEQTTATDASAGTKRRVFVIVE